MPRDSLIVHGSIAYADAVAIRLAGVKSTSDNHHNAIGLLADAAAREKDRDRALGHLKRIIEEKSRVSYSGEAFRRAEIDAGVLPRCLRKVQTGGRVTLPSGNIARSVPMFTSVVAG